MEDSESRARSRRQGDQGACGPEPLSSEPWYRFMPKQPKSLGIVILIFGCAELFMGLQLGGDLVISSILYTSFWQGTLFLVCGILSIYTGIHPSMTMVTGCLVMYLVSFIGGLFFFFIRLYYTFWFIVGVGLGDKASSTESWKLQHAIEVILMISSVCVLLILLGHFLNFCFALICKLCSCLDCSSSDCPTSN